jgi:hypothetical protein
VSDTDVERGKGHLTLAHELAHRREGIFTKIFDERADRSFWKELAVWESALDKHPDIEGDDKAYLLDCLGTYLGGVADEFGYDSKEYREAMYGYDRFMRRYL